MQPAGSLPAKGSRSRGTLGTDLSVGVVVGVGSGSRIHLVCLPACLPSLVSLCLPSASPAPERCCFFHANNPTILQSCCAVCLSVVSQQAIRPIRALQAPFPIACSWHIVTMAACVTLLDGSLRQIPSVLRACCCQWLLCLCSRREISNCQVARTVVCRAHAAHASRITAVNLQMCHTISQLENSQRHRSLLARARRLPRCRRSIPLPCTWPIGIASATPPKDWHEGLNLMP
jgi:hypothetical protein